MRKKGKIYLVITIGVLILISGFIVWFMTIPFEGQKPILEIEPLPEFLTGSERFSVTASDMKSGLRSVRVTINQKGREVVVFEKKFPSEGLLVQKGLHHFDSVFSIGPKELKLVQGALELQVRIRDYSRRNSGEGNLAEVQHKMVVDTVPPMIRPVSRLNYVNVGGAGLIVYQASSDAVESGLFVNKHFFKGFPFHNEAHEPYHVCYFAIPYEIGANPKLYLTAKDRAGNQSEAGFNYRVRDKAFRTRKSVITEQFLQGVLPYFSSHQLASEDSNIEKFLKINRELREENRLTYIKLAKETTSERLWEGPFLRHRNAATTARFADQRIYYYKGGKIDQQTHMGVDLASLANSEVEAANNGRVIFSDRLGIYGLTVVLDHGQGVASTYSHLSKKLVEVGQKVKKGDVIGLTGQTGLAGGDHLHFGIMVGGVFVNPAEWWDSHWVQDNIVRKLALINR
jgi:murein DD-endopeptidase MepM/ murein hydrolase activator NlpD